MKSWIIRNADAVTLSKGKVTTFYFSSFSPEFTVQDIVFILNNEDPAILYGWGIVTEIGREERYVTGDDEEANTPPYTSYYIENVKVVCEESFDLPLLLSAYLSANDFKGFEDEYGNTYSSNAQELQPSLAEKLNRVIGFRQKTTYDNNKAEDEFSNTYVGKPQEIRPALANKLNQAISQRQKLGAPIFLSYAREDIDIAIQLYERLSKHGFDIWLDKVSLLPGQNWKYEIRHAIHSSRAFIAILSNNSLTKRGYVQNELKQALMVLEEIPPSQIYLIPVRKEECEPNHSILQDTQWVDVFPDFDVGVQKIISALRTSE